MAVRSGARSAGARRAQVASNARKGRNAARRSSNGGKGG